MGEGNFMWFLKSKDEVINELQADALKGLTSGEAGSRLSKYGENKLAAKSQKPCCNYFLHS
jgi:Ca2+-transporting ATPase